MEIGAGPTSFRQLIHQNRGRLKYRDGFSAVLEGRFGGTVEADNGCIHRRETMQKRIFASLLEAIVLLSTMAALAGCNTVYGIGQDIERGGAAIQGEANEHRK